MTRPRQRSPSWSSWRGTPPGMRQSLLVSCLMSEISPQVARNPRRLAHARAVAAVLLLALVPAEALFRLWPTAEPVPTENAVVVHSERRRTGLELDPLDRCLLVRALRRRTTAFCDPVIDGDPDTVVVAGDRAPAPARSGMPVVLLLLVAGRYHARQVRLSGARLDRGRRRPARSRSADRRRSRSAGPPRAAEAVGARRRRGSRAGATMRGPDGSLGRVTSTAPRPRHDRHEQRPGDEHGPRRRRRARSRELRAGARRGLRGQPGLGRRAARRRRAARDHPLGHRRGAVPLAAARAARPRSPPTGSARPASLAIARATTRRTAPAGPAATATARGGGSRAAPTASPRRPRARTARGR